MDRKYRIDCDDSIFSGNTYSTLTEARAAIRRMNGGRLHGKFDADLESECWAEGWNLGRHEGCATAVIVRVTAVKQ